MSDRFAELLAKGKAGRLSPAETKELARLLNAPILDPVATPPPGFASKHPFVPSEVGSRLRNIQWFSACGSPVSLDLSMSIERVGSWQEAGECCRDPTWEQVELEAQNQLTLWLHLHDRQNYQRWNEIAAQHKAAVIDPLTREQWQPYVSEHGLDLSVVHSVQWNVLGALMENSYLSSGHGCFFFVELLMLYEAGHFPCGWKGEWPRGTLLVY